MILEAVLNYLVEHRPVYDWGPQWHDSSMVRIASLNSSLPLYYIEYFPDRNTIEIVIVDSQLAVGGAAVNVIDLCDTEILNKLGQIIPA